MLEWVQGRVIPDANGAGEPGRETESPTPLEFLTDCHFCVRSEHK